MDHPKRTTHQPPHRTLSADQAFAHLLRTLHRYIDGELCPDCEKQVSASLCSQLQMLAQAPQIGAATRESCLDLMEHWMHRPEERYRFGGNEHDSHASQPRSNS